MTYAVLFFRYAFLRVLQKLGWSHVASLTQDGHRYSEYVSHLQDILHKNNVKFIMNRKFPRDAKNMTMVRTSVCTFGITF